MKRAGASSPPATAACDLYRLLADAVVRSPAECSRRVAIADSKALYSPALGLRQLERGVLAAVGALRSGSGTLPATTTRRVDCARDLVHVTGADPAARRRELACHLCDELALPMEVDGDDLGDVASMLATACTARGVTLLAMRARLVFPAEFNDLCDQFGTKGAALSHVTLALVRETVDQLSTDNGQKTRDIFLFLDKHGGRSRYAALVQHHFPDGWIDAIVESQGESRYQWEYGGRRITAAFRVGCEELLPTALASMTAKYHRELVMRAFNAFWTSRVPGLRPTAGYPGDSRRFKADIAAAQRDLRIDDRALWRSR